MPIIHVEATAYSVYWESEYKEEKEEVVVVSKEKPTEVACNRYNIIIIITILMRESAVATSYNLFRHRP